MTAGGPTLPFVWPAEQPDSRAPATPPHEPPISASTPSVRRSGVLGALERCWLTLAVEPIDARIAALGWAPDDPDAFCDRCGSSVGPAEPNEFGCAACRGRRLPWARLVRLGAYRPPVSAWVQEVKFSAAHHTARSLGRRLGRRLLAHGLADGAQRVAIVPVGMPRLRRIRRGIDHGRAIALGVAAEVDAPVRPALGRTHRPSQRSVAPSDRAKNVRGSFRARWPRRWGAPDRVVLIDDVRTSGATLRAATRALRAAIPGDPSVWVGVLAVSDEHRRAAADRAVAGGGGPVDNRPAGAAAEVPGGGRIGVA